MPELGQLTTDEKHSWDGKIWKAVNQPAIGERTSDDGHYWAKEMRYKAVAWTVPKSYFLVIMVLLSILVIMIAASLWGVTPRPAALPTEVIGLASTIVGGLIGILVPSPIKR